MPINHVVEVTMVGFFQVAQVVQPITVCLKEATQDSYSGARFSPGRQQINAAQAVAFVRQRRDNIHPDLNVTDLDRSRRQQAFIASLAFQRKAADTLTSPGKLNGILDVAKQNVAVDSGLDLLSFARQASGLTGGQVTFYTLPIDHFGTDPLGESVNIVDLPLIHATVQSLLGGNTPTPHVTPTTARAVLTSVVNVSNATGRSGRANELLKALSQNGHRTGAADTHPTLLPDSVVQYPQGLAQKPHRWQPHLVGSLPNRARRCPREPSMSLSGELHHADHVGHGDRRLREQFDACPGHRRASHRRRKSGSRTQPAQCQVRRRHSLRQVDGTGGKEPEVIAGLEDAGDHGWPFDARGSPPGVRD